VKLFMTLYVVCFVSGVVLSALAFISGLHNVSFFDHDHIFGGHAHGGGPVRVSHGHVHHGAAHAKGGSHAAQGGSRLATVLSWLNMAAAMAFLTWFGGAGIVLQQVTTWPSRLVVAASIGAGILGGSVVNRFIQTLVRDEKPLEPTSFVGVLAKVTSPIREGGTGEIVYTINGTRQTAGARDVDGQAVPKGSEVVITRYEKGIAYVSTFDELSAITLES
jgi:membrane protein implicated in regulation of membrane protease activity